MSSFSFSFSFHARILWRIYLLIFRLRVALTSRDVNIFYVISKAIAATVMSLCVRIRLMTAQVVFMNGSYTKCL
jgi:hypothetical protein